MIGEASLSFKHLFTPKLFLNRIYEWARQSEDANSRWKTIAEIFWDATTNADGKKLLVLIEEIARTCHVLRAGMALHYML